MIEKNKKRIKKYYEFIIILPIYNFQSDIKVNLVIEMVHLYMGLHMRFGIVLIIARNFL